MPTTRRTTRSADGVLKQATLSFNHRVTKPVPKSAKDAVVSDKDATPVRPSPLSEVTQPDDEPAVSPTEEQAPDEPVAPTPVSAPAPVPAPEQSEAELEAGRITDARIAHYLRGIEAQRLAKPVHQEELGVGEKVLRHFDVSSQYGPCIGIARIRRWKRAQKLGLNPPIEVLAVLLKEEASGTQGVEKAHMDVILSATAVGV